MKLRPRTVTLLVVAYLVCVGAGRSAEAVPSLQLYSEGAEYRSATESWLSTEDPFELWVVGAKTPQWVELISDITLLVAVPDGYWDPTAQVDISPILDKPEDNNPLTGFASVHLDSSNVLYGDPDDFGLYDPKQAKYPDHGTYPAHFWAVALPDLLPDPLTGPGETVYDFSADYDPDDPSTWESDVGDIQYYEISYTPFSPEFMLHMDVVGLAHNGNEKWTFAPLSHDADAMAVPEPTSLALLGLGLAAGALVRRRR